MLISSYLLGRVREVLPCDTNRLSGSRHRANASGVPGAAAAGSSEEPREASLRPETRGCSLSDKWNVSGHICRRTDANVECGWSRHAAILQATSMAERERTHPPATRRATNTRGLGSVDRQRANRRAFPRKRQKGCRLWAPFQAPKTGKSARLPPKAPKRLTRSRH